jgi:hypothetical protein
MTVYYRDELGGIKVKIDDGIYFLGGIAHFSVDGEKCTIDLNQLVGITED